MKLLFLLIITIVFSSNLDAKTEELDRDKYHYTCFHTKIEVDRRGNTKCEGIKKGDVLVSIPPRLAVIYCDKDHLVIHGTDSAGNTDVACRYNGEPITEQKKL